MPKLISIKRPFAKKTKNIKKCEYGEFAKKMKAAETAFTKMAKIFSDAKKIIKDIDSFYDSTSESYSEKHTLIAAIQGTRFLSNWAKSYSPKMLKLTNASNDIFNNKDLEEIQTAVNNFITNSINEENLPPYDNADKFATWFVEHVDGNC